MAAVERYICLLAIGLTEDGAVIYSDDEPIAICAWEWAEGWPCLELQRELEDACGERDVRMALYDAVERWRADAEADREDERIWAVA